jgi:hypothetical protein
MGRFLVDTNIPIQIPNKLRSLGHDVTRVQDVEGTSRPVDPMTDEAVLALGASTKRAVITINWKDFDKLHQGDKQHYGIIVCRMVDGLDDGDLAACRRRAKDIDELVKHRRSLKAQLFVIPPVEDTGDNFAPIQV